MSSATLSVSEVWREILAPKFIRHREILVSGAKPHGERAVTLFGPKPGDLVLDVGCGFGDATAELAERVGASGSATGIDVVPEFLSLARAAAPSRKAGNLCFTLADAETFEPLTAFDYVFARFGTMFFERPVAAFRNLHGMLRPAGRLVMTTWRALEENPWLHLAKEIARLHLPPLTENAVSCGPGPFSLSEPDLIRALLTRSGFSQISIVPSDAVTLVGATIAEAIDFQLAIGPAGEIVREAGLEGQRALPELRRALAATLQPFLTERGVSMRSAAWIVHASA